jgi:Na+-translocating ferredoxin:NAD+ oxidoreductase RnfC subunit
MRSLAFSTSGSEHWSQWSELCCACGICTLYACPEDLYPKEACDDGKRDRRAAGLKFVQQKPVEVHPMKEFRRVPLSQLRKRLQLDDYERPTPFEALSHKPKSVRIKLKQHAGAPAVATVQEGKKVRKGQVVGQVDPKQLGASVHSSIDGKVKQATPDYIEIVA